MPRILSVIAALTLTILAPVTPAVADAYGPQSGDATVSATTIRVGNGVRVGGDAFCPRTPVVLTAHTDRRGIYLRRSLRADRRGDVTTWVRLTGAGTNTLFLTGRQADCTGLRVLSAEVRVTWRHTDDSDNERGGTLLGLPGTGGTLTPAYAGLGLLAAGSLLVFVARSRRRITLDAGTPPAG